MCRAAASGEASAASAEATVGSMAVTTLTTDTGLRGLGFRV